MAEAQLAAQKKRINSDMDSKPEVRKKSRSDGRSKQKSPSMLLHLSPQVILAMWKEKDTIRMQIDDGEKKSKVKTMDVR